MYLCHLSGQNIIKKKLFPDGMTALYEQFRPCVKYTRGIICDHHVRVSKDNDGTTW